MDDERTLQQVRIAIAQAEHSFRDILDELEGNSLCVTDIKIVRGPIRRSDARVDYGVVERVEIVATMKREYGIELKPGESISYDGSWHREG